MPIADRASILEGPPPHRLSCVAIVVMVAMLAGSALSCTEAKLEPIPPEPSFRDDKIQVAGKLCTREPDTLTFPLRVMFIVDSSSSMAVTDPPDPVTGQTGRERAVEETWTNLLDQGPEGVRVGILRFSAQAQSRTAQDTDGDGLPDTYFTADRILLDIATNALAITDRTTNYANALNEAYFEIREELRNASQESLPLSKYIVVFLSDGLPDTDDIDSRGNAEDEILQSVDNLRELAQNFRVGDFQFHTAYLSGGLGDVFDRQAQELLQRMAEVGNGTFRSFPSGEELNFLFIDFTVLKRVFTLRSLVALNTNTVMDLTQLPQMPELRNVNVQPNPFSTADPMPLQITGTAFAGTQAPITSVVVEVTDAEGIVVHREEVAPEMLTADFNFQWNGTDDASGAIVADDDYTITITARNAFGVEIQQEGTLVLAQEPGAVARPLGEPEIVTGLNPSSFVDLDGNGWTDCGEPLVDSDADGLSDLNEFAFNTNPLVRDTDDDGINDFIEWDLRESGLDPLMFNQDSCFVAPLCVDTDGDQLCDCLFDLDSNGVCDCAEDPESPGCVDPVNMLDCKDNDGDQRCDCPDYDFDGKCDYVDTDGDGLHNCEEVLFASAQNGNDTDADGLPDVIEINFRTNPTEADDAEDDDFDLTINGVEVRAATDPQCDDATFRSRVAYRYQVDELGLEGAKTCYEFNITNITLVPTLDNYDSDDLEFPGNGVNRILLYAGEVAFDDPQAFALYRVACIEASYRPEVELKNPPSGSVILTEDDFIDILEFDPEMHCKR